MSDNGRILIVDDDASYLAMVSKLLIKEGYDCDCAGNAFEAVHFLRSVSYDLVISDIEMPGNQNLALIREIPQIQAGIPVILVTAYPTTQSALQALKLLVWAYLVKPPDIGELLQEVRKSVESYRAIKALQQNRLHVSTWLEDLERIEEVIKDSKGKTSVEAGSTFLSLAIKNMAQSLGDLQRFALALSRQKTGQEGAGRLDPDLALVQALHKTISVLEKSKSAFKSKELGDLRRELELLAGKRDRKI